jgi:SH3-like domain-containing protein
MKTFINLIVGVLLLLPQGAAALCVQGDCVNGQGTVVLPDGRRYVGEFREGIRSGRGLMTFPDGTKYLGDWQNDKPHGQGTLSSIGKFEYAGAFADGVREGRGTLETVDGKKYTGEWQNDVPHGQGKIIYPDGGTFIGQFENGRRNGQGEAIYSDGTKYAGHWKDDLPNGLGTKIYVDGEKYTGEFTNGLMHGQGTFVNSDGSSYTGQWQNDVLLKKEELVTEPELSTVDETEGHVLAVVDEKPAEPAIAAGAGAVAVEPLPAAPSEDIANSQAGFASVNQNGVFVRSGPSTEYRIVRSVSRGFPVQVIGQQDNWSNVKDFVGQEGWIFTPLLGLNNSAIVNVLKGNLRSGPGLNFTIINQVDFGTVLQMKSIESDWYLVTAADGTEGWLSRELIWPAGHTVVPAPDVAAAAATTEQKDMQPDRTVEFIIRQRVEETSQAVRMEAPGLESEPAAEMPEGEVEVAASAAVASATDVAVASTPPESTVIPEPNPVEPIVEPINERGYAGVAQNGRGANIRSEPSLAAEVLRAVPPGFPMTVLERQGDWALVEDFRERRGWVYAALLTDLQTVVIKVGKGNLRSGPSLLDESVAQLDYGVIMFIDESRGDWLKVSNPEGLAGWLHRDIIWP